MIAQDEPYTGANPIKKFLINSLTVNELYRFIIKHNFLT
jgi:hypothetical protein